MIHSRKKKGCCFFLLVTLAFLAFGCSSRSDRQFSQTIAKTSAFIQDGMSKNNIAGMSIALVHGGRIVWAEGFGAADKEKGIPAAADTVYMIGSASKTLTTAALLNLSDQGLVSLEEPAQTYLPEFTVQSRFQNQIPGMTVRRLLNHHSGIPGDIYNGGFVETSWDDWNNSLFVDWLLGYLKDDYPTYAPGEIGSYCNTGFILAGEIFRRRSGGGLLNDAMTRTLFQPLGMNHTSFRIIRENLAAGYVDGQPIPPMEANMTATGGAYSTVTDMAQFLIMLLNRGLHPNGNRILQPDTVAMMRQAETSSLDINSYAKFGLGLDTVDDPALRYAGPAWAKNGSTGIFNAFLEILPDQDLGVIVLSNSDTAKTFVYAAARECLKNAVAERYGVAPTMPALPQLVSESDPDKIAGTYVRTNGYDKISRNTDGTLTWLVGAHAQAPEHRVLSFDGEAFAVAGRTERLVFTNRIWDGTPHFLMVQYGSSGSAVDEEMYGGYAVYTLGEKYTPPAIPPAWLTRTNKIYLTDNIPWNDWNWSAPYIRLEAIAGVLVGGKSGEQAVLVPQNDTLAFLAGSVNRSDSSVRVILEDGREKLVFGGYQGYDIDQVPPLVIGDVIQGHIDFHKTAWYRFTSATAGQQILFALAGNDPRYTLRLFNSSLDGQAAETGSLAWASEPGTWYLAISPTPDATGDYTLTVTN